MVRSIEQAREAFTSALQDDLNTAAGLAAIFDLVRDINAAIDAKQIGREDADSNPWPRRWHPRSSTYRQML